MSESGPAPRLDPISLSVNWGARQSITVEVGTIVHWTAHSQEAREGQNFYAHRYGYSDAQAAAELVTVPVTAIGSGPDVRLAEQPSGIRDTAAARKLDRAVYLPDSRGYVQCALYGRARLPVGARIEGPTVVEPESTTVLPPGTAVDPWASILVILA